jgi:hypothetical protein
VRVDLDQVVAVPVSRLCLVALAVDDAVEQGVVGGLVVPQPESLGVMVRGSGRDRGAT